MNQVLLKQSMHHPHQSNGPPFLNGPRFWEAGRCLHATDVATLLQEFGLARGVSVNDPSSIQQSQRTYHEALKQQDFPYKQHVNFAPARKKIQKPSLEPW